MSWAIWITGVPGSGKSTLARAVAERLAVVGQPAMVLELDRMRHFVTPTPTYSDAERDVVYRALVWLAATLAETGIPVVIDATAHWRAWRDLARAVIPRFAEVQLTCPLEVAVEREASRAPGAASSGIYARAGSSGARVPGVDVPYEFSVSPELAIDTSSETVEHAAPRIVALALTLADTSARPPLSDRWALWITGLPGSGKTTLAWSAAEKLEAEGIPVRVLAFTDLRALVGSNQGAGGAEDILHRAVVYAAWLLTRAGVAVIIDATAPRRAWRRLARKTIARFGEVQLLCPADICMSRERAARWSGAGVCGARRSAAAPDIVLDYETSTGAELTVATDVESTWSATDAVVRLARRLHRTTRTSEDQPCASKTS